MWIHSFAFAYSNESLACAIGRACPARVACVSLTFVWLTLTHKSQLQLALPPLAASCQLAGSICVRSQISNWRGKEKSALQDVNHFATFVCHRVALASDAACKTKKLLLLLRSAGPKVNANRPKQQMERNQMKRSPYTFRRRSLLARDGQ